MEQVVDEPMTAGERQIDKKMKMIERQAELEQEGRDDKHSKAKELLSYNPQFNLQKGLKEAVKWYWKNL